MDFDYGKLEAPQARRVWSDEKDIPEATKYLLEQCAKEEIVVSVITVELVEGQWAIVAWGD